MTPSTAPAETIPAFPRRSGARLLPVAPITLGIAGLKFLSTD